MHPLLQLNLASPAEPPMSIQYPPVRASSGSTSLNNLRLAAAFAISGAASDPSAAFASGFTFWLGWRRFSDSRQHFVPPTVPAINSRCPTGHQLNETLLPLNLWMQVQKTSKFVDFTKLGAEREVSSDLRALCMDWLALSHVFQLTFALKMH